MFRNSKLEATKVYLFIEIAVSLCFSMMFVVTSLYEATVAGLTPVQLVLVGTTVELSIFLFEIPTGVVADAYSRRLSIIIGYILIGAGTLLEGFFPAFLPILLAQVIWGLGYTFTSGATEAWITDEIGEESANKLFLRATRFSLVGSLIGMGLAIWVGANSVALPIRAGAFGVIFIGFALVVIMPEKGFHPTPQEERNTWQHMWHTFHRGVQAVRGQPRLMTIVGIGLFYGLYSEGFDRLWVKHLIDSFSLPILIGSNQVAFFGLLRVAGSLLTIFAMYFVEKRVDTASPIRIGRALLIVTGLICLLMIGFALSPLLFLTICLYLAINVLRNVNNPLSTAWINQKLDSQVRATIHSMFGQVDAIGQIAGGPIVAGIAALGSIVASIVASGLLLIPALPLIARANSQTADEGDTKLESQMDI